MHTYDDEFFKYVNSGAINSANEIINIFAKAMPVKSVLDVGCGQGAWLSVWQQHGVTDILGIDGDYVEQNNLLVDKKCFCSYDLSNTFNLNRRFDIVQSLEVAEHLPKSSAKGFVESLVKHGDIVLFSSAPKGQGGDHHINEQDYNYWRALFCQHKYQAIDYLRPLISGKTNIEPWYRYNTFLYVSSDYFEKLPPDIKCCVVREDEMLQDISPLTYKIRKKLISFLPVSIMTAVAKLKEIVVIMLRTKQYLK